MEKKSIWDLHRPNIEDYRRREKIPVTIVLDNIRSLNNIGSIFRTADAFLIEKIFLCGITATPPSIEIHKTALGAEDSVEWIYFPSTMEAVNLLREQKYEVCVLEQVKGSIDLNEFCPSKDHKYAVVAGHEVNGVDPEIVNAADVCLEIPQCGTKHSLNVAVSSGIAMWHFFQNIYLNSH